MTIEAMRAALDALEELYKFDGLQDGFDDVKLIQARDSLRAAITQAEQQGDVQANAARYALLRRGQHWSVINGVGDILRAESLDAAIDLARGAGEV